MMDIINTIGNGLWKVVAWFFCWRTYNRTPITNIFDNICNTLYSNIVILFHDIPGIKNNYLCIHGVQQQEVYARLLLIPVKCPLFGLPSLHLFPIPVFHACVYMFLFCVRPAVLVWGGVGEYVIQCIFATQPDSVYLTQIFCRYCDCRRINRNMKNFVGEYS